MLLMEAARIDHDEESELELGLSLGSGVAVKSSAAAGKGSWSGGGGGGGRILTAKDFPSGISVLSSTVGSGNGKGHIFAAAGYGSTKKRAAADSVAEQDNSTSSNGVSQVVGWPPIRTYRINSLTRESKNLSSEDDKDMGKNEKFKDTSKQKVSGDQNSTSAQGNGSLGFVKVNMDGLPIGRKIDLSAHTCYETLAQTLEDMFFKSTQTAVTIQSGSDMELDRKTPKLLDGSSDFVLTYEDKDGDWMLVGDVPWGMFLNTVKRLRIMRTAEANGLSPGTHERQRTKPI